MTKPPTSDISQSSVAAGAVLPKWLESLIGNFAWSCEHDPRATIRKNRAALVDGIQRYASTPQPPPEASVPDEWRTLVNDLATDLENEIENRRAGELPRRIERDLEIVRTARRMLSAAPAPKESHEQ